MYDTNRAMVEAYRKYAHMHAKAPPPPSTPTGIGGRTVPEHAKHEKGWVKWEPRKEHNAAATHGTRKDVTPTQGA